MINYYFEKMMPRMHQFLFECLNDPNMDKQKFKSMFGGIPADSMKDEDGKLSIMSNDIIAYTEFSKFLMMAYGTFPSYRSSMEDTKGDYGSFAFQTNRLIFNPKIARYVTATGESIRNQIIYCIGKPNVTVREFNSKNELIAEVDVDDPTGDFYAIFYAYKKKLVEVVFYIYTVERLRRRTHK